MTHPSIFRTLRILPILLGLAFLGACTPDEIITPGLEEPRDLTASYSWQLDRWNNAEPIGSPRVELQWSIPTGWRGDPFRVYGRRGAGGPYNLIATVTACSSGVCTYVDTNVRSGEAYHYYVAAVDERGGREAESSRVQVNVPVLTVPAVPTDVNVTGLDGMAFLRWRQTTAQRFRVLLQVGQEYFDLGETDSQSFLDDRAENGQEQRYLVAAIDTLGHFSRLSAVVIGVPRPDYHAEILYPMDVNAAESGFRFVASPESQDPVLAGDAPSAQWRLETINGAVTIRPLGATRVTQGTFTTALSCGPGAESDCIDVKQAPAASAFTDVPVQAQTASTYVFRVTGPESRTHYAKVRVLGTTRDTLGRTVLVFDWAYQLRADDVRLNVGVAK
jgi:hypothetical protein